MSMNAQQFPPQEPDIFRAMGQTLKAIPGQIRESTSNLLRAAGIRISPGGMTIDSSLTVAGDFTTSGNASITGTLNLPAGIIGNDALTSPVQFFADFNDSGALTITTSEATVCTKSFVVPAGFHTVFVVGYGSIGIINPTASASSIGGRVYIDRPSSTSVWGPLRYQEALAGSDAASYPYKQTVIDGLVGGETVTVRMVALAYTNWGATPGGASLNVTAYFTR